MSIETVHWLVFEGDGEQGASYADFDDQVEMSPAAAAEYGFPLPNWTPTIPTRGG